MKDLQNLQVHIERVLHDEPAMVDKIREVLQCAQIKREYKQECKGRWGEARQVMEELSVKHFNTPYRVDFIHDVIYRKYR